MAEQVETAALSSGAVPESDNLIVKSALFARSAITSAPALSPACGAITAKSAPAALGRFLKEYRPHPALYLAVALAVFGGVSFAQNHQLATGVSVNGTYVGAVANPDVFQQASAFVRTSASEALGYDYNFENEALSTHPVIVANDALISEEALVDKICDANNIVNNTYVLEVNGQARGQRQRKRAGKRAEGQTQRIPHGKHHFRGIHFPHFHQPRNHQRR